MFYEKIKSLLFDQKVEDLNIKINCFLIEDFLFFYLELIFFTIIELIMIF